MTDSEILDRQILEYTTTPHWENGCKHDLDTYLFSFTCIETPTEEVKYDVYCFRDYRDRQEFCLRFGNDSGDYCSPGTIENILVGQSLNRYRDCITLLKSIGRIEFVKGDLNE